jgi:mono/diheme cytochrome c family protein
VIALALATVLAQTPSPAPIVPQADAEEIFQKRCVLCHGADGRGKTKKGREYKTPNFTSARYQEHTRDDEIREAITNGVPKTKMKGFKDKLTPEQIEALFRYVRSLGSKRQPK